MSYRSLKKVLGERNLERKCLLLFSIALLLLVGGGFWWVDHIAENLVMDTTNSKARDLVDIVLYDIHWDRWTKPDEKPLRAQVVQDLLSSRFEKKVLSTAFESRAPVAADYIAAPADAEERAILEELRGRQLEQLAELARLSATPEVSPDRPDPLAAGEPLAQERSFQPVFETRVSMERGKYYYYQPVYWKSNCIRCHEGFYGKFATAAGDDRLQAQDAFPFVVVKVSMPYEETGMAIAATRAILVTVAILTVVVAIIALWVIVRYVVVKPLNHLRNVSDAVTRGHIEQRAEIQTGDEFEDLATSFNKMLRSLVDTQAEIRNINKDLDAKVDELAQLNMRLYEMNRMKSDFLANMSHELRTPLNSIIGFSEVLQGIESLTDKQRRYALNIQKSGRVLLDMINDILDLAKLEAGRMELRLTEFQIDRIIHAQCDMVRSLTEEKNIDLVVNADPELPPVYQDQGKIQQILTNLLSNAIKFTPEGGRITVSARSTPQGMIEMKVADTGVGIAEADRDVIFEKFRQGSMVLGRDSLTREFSGTGLGLSIVKELCKRLGGEVFVDSEVGRGSNFTVLLPWMVVEGPRQATQLAARLDDLARPHRGDFEPGGASSREANGDSVEEGGESEPSPTAAGVGNDR
jgi:two-component system, NarL family, sensor histidine kinase BarA